MSSHICGRYSMCSFDMHFYLTNMKGVVIPEGVKPAEEYKQNYTRVMTSFGYPFDLSVDVRNFKALPKTLSPLY